MLQETAVSPSSRGLLALGLAAAIWGGMYVGSDALMRTVPPLVVLELREGISAVILLPIAARAGKLRVARRDWPRILAIGVVGFTISIGFQLYGTHLAGAALGSLVTASSPVLIALLGAAYLKESVPRQRWAAIGLAFAGVVIVVGTPAGGPGTVTGVILLLLAAGAWALYTVGSASLGSRYDAITVVSLACGVGAITTLPLALYAGLSSPHSLPTTWMGWSEVAYISVFGMAMAFFLWVWGFRRVTASRGGVMLLCQPLVGILLGVILLGERISIGTMVGALLISVGVMLALREPRSSGTAQDSHEMFA